MNLKVFNVIEGMEVFVFNDTTSNLYLTGLAINRDRISYCGTEGTTSKQKLVIVDSKKSKIIKSIEFDNPIEIISFEEKY